MQRALPTLQRTSPLQEVTMPKKEDDTRELLITLFCSLWNTRPWPLHYWKGDFWQWIGTVYRQITENDVGALFQDALIELNHSIDPSQIKRLLDVAKWEVAVPDYESMPVLLDKHNSDLYQSNLNRFAFSNGVLDFDEWQRQGKVILHSHTPLWFSDQCVDFKYNGAATCPQWDTFLSESLPDEGVRDLLQMWFGYCLTYDMSHQKFLLVYGPAATGKSVTANILGKIVGSSGVSAVPLKAFGTSFSLYQTLGKRVNIDPDMSELDKVDEGTLKSYVGGDLIQIERKYRDPVTTRPTAKLMFCTNDLPHISDRTNATWRRMILLPFNNVVPPEKQRRGLLTELSKELPGIWNWAFAGYKMLQELGHFPEFQVIKDAIIAYKTEVSPVRQWVEEQCTLGVNHEIKCESAYTMFISWTETRGYKPPSQRSFGKSFAAANGSKVERILKRVGRKSKWHYRGLYIEPECDR
jgi:P4 family phage/plasmid primase-like protien